MTLSEKQQVFTYNLAHLVLWGYTNRFKLTYGEATRTQSQVLLNFYGYDVVSDNGTLSLKKRPSTSKTLESIHTKRMAVDFNIFYEGRMLFPAGQSKEDFKKDLEITRKLGDYWMTLNTDNVWGSDWNKNHIDDESFHDPYHFEMKP
jgi:hypothetical protein